MSNAFFWPLWVLYSGAHAHTQTCSSKYKLIKIKPLKILFIRCLCVVPCTWTGGANVSMVHVEARGQLGVTFFGRGPPWFLKQGLSQRSGTNGVEQAGWPGSPGSACHHLLKTVLTKHTPPCLAFDMSAGIQTRVLQGKYSTRGVFSPALPR